MSEANDFEHFVRARKLMIVKATEYELELIRQADIFNVGTCEDCRLTEYQLIKLIRLTREKEREACAKVCDDGAKALESFGAKEGARGANSCAVAIRLRSNSE